MALVIDPESGEIRVDDTVRIDRQSTRFEFILNSGLTVRTTDGDLQRISTSADGLRSAYRVTLQTPAATLKLYYHGKPVFSSERRLGDMPQGIVSDQGVYLDGASAWYPLFDLDIDRVRMSVQLPAGWQAVSIGRRGESGGTVTWTSQERHDDLYLIAGRFTRYTRRHGDVDLSVYLLHDDAALAGKYLGLIGGYIDHYSHLIGEYPYAKFAVVENHWQTGFGMPSFTLLGSRVLRLPFIPYTSLPHEILHNWWGNGVWVDYAKGNWSEGLTAYLADHWMQERQGKGDQYRLKALQRYSNFAARGTDQPLLDFVSRHNDASQSIGYSKSLMLFHMLRNALGDDGFVVGLRRLWQTHQHARIGFAETIRTIAAADQAAVQRFLPWLERAGAPNIRLADSGVNALQDGWQLRLTVDQEQSVPFVFDLPVLITLQGEDYARRVLAPITDRRTLLEYSFDKRPLRVDIDPEYDLLRYLDPTEQPPALNRLFGSSQTWLVLPTAAGTEMREAWIALTEAWQRRYPQLKLIDDTSAGRLPSNADRLLLGWDNALLDPLRAGFVREDQSLGDGEVTIKGARYPADAVGLVLVASDAQGVTTGFIGAPTPQLIATLARKLPHYGSYGRLLFDGQGENLRRDTLSSDHSRLSRQFGNEPAPLRPPPRSVLGAGGD
jgi:aminopeptidase N